MGRLDAQIDVVTGGRQRRIELDPRSWEDLQAQFAEQGMAMVQTVDGDPLYRGMPIVVRDEPRDRRLIGVRSRSRYSRPEPEMSIDEMRAYYRAEEIAMSVRRRRWAGRCCAYYGADNLAQITEWQRESYCRIHDDKEPTR